MPAYHDTHSPTTLPYPRKAPRNAYTALDASPSTTSSSSSSGTPTTTTSSRSKPTAHTLDLSRLSAEDQLAALSQRLVELTEVSDPDMDEIEHLEKQVEQLELQQTQRFDVLRSSGALPDISAAAAAAPAAKAPVGATASGSVANASEGTVSGPPAGAAPPPLGQATVSEAAPLASASKKTAAQRGHVEVSETAQHYDHASSSKIHAAAAAAASPSSELTATATSPADTEHERAQLEELARLKQLQSKLEQEAQRKRAEAKRIADEAARAPELLKQASSGGGPSDKPTLSAMGVGVSIGALDLTSVGLDNPQAPNSGYRLPLPQQRQRERVRGDGVPPASSSLSHSHLLELGSSGRPARTSVQPLDVAVRQRSGERLSTEEQERLRPPLPQAGSWSVYERHPRAQFRQARQARDRDPVAGTASLIGGGSESGRADPDDFRSLLQRRRQLYGGNSGSGSDGGEYGADGYGSADPGYRYRGEMSGVDNLDVLPAADVGLVEAGAAMHLSGEGSAPPTYSHRRHMHMSQQDSAADALEQQQRQPQRQHHTRRGGAEVVSLSYPMPAWLTAKAEQAQHLSDPESEPVLLQAVDEWPETLQAGNKLMQLREQLAQVAQDAVAVGTPEWLERVSVADKAKDAVEAAAALGGAHEHEHEHERKLEHGRERATTAKAATTLEVAATEAKPQQQPQPLQQPHQQPQPLQQPQQQNQAQQQQKQQQLPDAYGVPMSWAKARATAVAELAQLQVRKGECSALALAAVFFTILLNRSSPPRRRKCQRTARLAQARQQQRGWGRS